VTFEDPYARDLSSNPKNAHLPATGELAVCLAVCDFRSLSRPLTALRPTNEIHKNKTRQLIDRRALFHFNRPRNETNLAHHGRKPILSGPRFSRSMKSDFPSLFLGRKELTRGGEGRGGQERKEGLVSVSRDASRCMMHA